ncbi:MAG: hypothetical protein JWP61_2091 [Friedmanniella sp.]|nr:hypothetical protein [Friedmanniella sp.]
MSWLRFPRVLGIIVCLYLVAMSVLFGLFSNQNYRFVNHAAETRGTVVELVARAPVGSTRGPRYDDGQSVSLAPKVRYEVAATTYEYVAAHGRFHQPLRVGDTVTVLYDPAVPSLARLKGEGSVLVPLITTGFVAAAVLVAAILFRTRRRSTSRAHPSVQEARRPRRRGAPRNRARGASGNRARGASDDQDPNQDEDQDTDQDTDQDGDRLQDADPGRPGPARGPAPAASRGSTRLR